MEHTPIILFLILVFSNSAVARFQQNGNHWGNEEDSLKDFKEYAETMSEEYMRLVKEQDAEDTAKKFSGVWVHPMFGTLTTEKDVMVAYQLLFAIGAASVDQTINSAAYLGDDYAVMSVTQNWKDIRGNTLFDSEDFSREYPFVHFICDIWDFVKESQGRPTHFKSQWNYFQYV